MQCLFEDFDVTAEWYQLIKLQDLFTAIIKTITYRIILLFFVYYADMNKKVKRVLLQFLSLILIVGGIFLLLLSLIYKEETINIISDFSFILIILNVIIAFFFISELNSAEDLIRKIELDKLRNKKESLDEFTYQYMYESLKRQKFLNTVRFYIFFLLAEISLILFYLYGHEIFLLTK